jgi:hypothetical protein
MSALVDQAKDEDVKEALLAYYFLARVGEKGMTLEMLDQLIEQHLMTRYGVFIDFEVDDAVLKLKKDGLVSEKKNGLLVALPIQQACKVLINQWEDIFSVAQRLALYR